MEFPGDKALLEYYAPGAAPGPADFVFRGYLCLGLRNVLVSLGLARQGVSGTDMKGGRKSRGDGGNKPLGVNRRPILRLVTTRRWYRRVGNSEG